MTTPEPRPDEATRFLDLVHPTSSRLLVSINPLAPKGKEEIIARTFMPGDDKGVTDFVRAAAQRGWNVYWTVNRVGRAMSKKCSRADISEIPYLHVDVDPRKPDADERLEMDKFLAKEQERMLGLFASPPMNIPVPTCVVISGGGVNGIWMLDTPLKVEGATDKERIQSAEGHKHYNRQIEKAFSADNCHNIDRVLRLPGTLNFPNHKKIADGRTQVTLARLHLWDPTRVYGIDSFIKAPLHREQAGGPPPKIKAPTGVLPRIARVEDLDLSKIPKTADMVRRVIATGYDPEEPKRFQDPNGKRDRSRAVFFVTCQLKKAGISDDQVYAIVTDPKFGISESILEKGASSERQALRAVERGTWAAECPELDELNSKHAVISSMGGKCVVIQEEKSEDLGRTMLTVSSFEDIRNRYSNRQVLIGTKTLRGGATEPVYQKLGSFWLDHPMRLQYESVVFMPGRDDITEHYNLWRGFAVEAIEGDCSLYLDHLLNVVCSGNHVYYNYMLNWMAAAVQRPAEQAEVCIVLKGEPGAGKGVVIREFGKLFGRHFLQILSAKQVTGQFNDHLRDCVVLFLDEAMYAGDPQGKNILKGLVTEDNLMVEKKGVDARQARNHLHIFMATNEDWALSADPRERRYFVLNVPSTKLKDLDYWNSLYTQMDNGGREALLYMLRTRDIEGFAPRNYPDTDALHDQKIRSLSTIQEWWLNKLNNGQVLAGHDKWTNPVIVERLVNDYLLYASKFSHRGRTSTATEVGIFLGKMMPGLATRKKTVHSRDDRTGHDISARHRVYVFPELEECRDAWDAEFQFKTNWPKDDGDDDPAPVQKEGGF